jgi:Tol biopolymer transport system component
MKGQYRCLVALVLGLAAAASTIGVPTAAAYPGANGKIAFESAVTGDFEIFVMAANGSGQTNVSNSSASAEGDPAWSPNGAKIAFTSSGEGHVNVWVMNANGSGKVNLTPGPQTSGEGNSGDHPTWSPDGSRIAYSNGDIWVMNAASGAGKVNLTPGDSHGFTPAWSPDGTRIAFGRGSDIWVMNADGSGQTPLATSTRGEFRPDWSPDGTKIVYDRDGQIWMMNADGSGQSALTGSTGESGSLPAWSPDGAKIVFASNAFRAPNGHDIFVMNADGTGITRLNTPVPAADLDPSWQPVPTRNVYVSGGVLTYVADGARSNAVTISLSAGTYTVTDTAGGLDAGPGCSPVSATQATCTGTISAIRTDLRDLNDSITVNGATRATLRGGTGNDTLTGGAGPDTLEGGNGADTFNGRGGIDTVTYGGRPVAVVVDIDNVADDGGTLDVAGAARDNVKTDVENVTGGSLGDTLTGSSANNVFDGGTGADTFNGLGGVDTVTYAGRFSGVVVDIDNVADDGRSPIDVSGALRDNVKTDVENITGGNGLDRLTGSSGNNVFNGGTGADTFNGLGGIDTVTYAGRAAAVVVDIDNIADDGSSLDVSGSVRDNVRTDIENVTGGNGGDTLTGSSAANALRGNPGNDRIFARDGVRDVVDGGTGTDEAQIDSGLDAVTSIESFIP